MNLCRREGVDVVQCHLSDAEFLGIAAAAFCRTPVIITTLHGPLPLMPRRPWWSARSMLRRVVTRLLYRCADHIVAVSDEVAAEARRLFAAPLSKLTTIINRIDTESYASPVDAQSVKTSLGIDPKQRVITTVSRLEPHKGQACLLSALGMLGSQYNDVRLLLLGEGTSRADLEDQCRRIGLADRVVFLGTRDDVRTILTATDIFAFPSFAEGTSLALMEAMAAGRPIVAADIPGNRTLLSHEKNAMLVPAGDAAALASALARLLDNPEEAQALGAQGRAFVRGHFDSRTTVAELERLWQSRAA
jgi:glycosyltransferase involved in cell wall biosynthesis